MDACPPQEELRIASGRLAARRPRARRRAGSRASLLALAVLAGALLAAASPAGAVIVHLRNGHALSYQPLRHATLRALTPRVPADLAFSNLDYNGGPIMPSNTNYTVYWDPVGGPKYPAEYQNGVNRYLEDLAHDSGANTNVDSVSAQYNDAAGQYAAYQSHFGSALIDTDPYPQNGCAAATICLTDAQIQAELANFVKAHGLPMDLEHEYSNAPRAARNRPTAPITATSPSPKAASCSTPTTPLWGTTRPATTATTRTGSPTPRSRAVSAMSTTSRSPTPSRTAPGPTSGEKAARRATSAGPENQRANSARRWAKKRA
jgi:hypothetical protein